jgi:hypothetical protein
MQIYLFLAAVICSEAVHDLNFAYGDFCFCVDLRLGSGEASGFRRHGAGELLYSPPSVCSGFVVQRAPDREVYWCPRRC